MTDCVQVLATGSVGCTLGRTLPAFCLVALAGHSTGRGSPRLHGGPLSSVKAGGTETAASVEQKARKKEAAPREDSEAHVGVS